MQKNTQEKWNDEHILTNGRDAIMCRTNDTVIRRLCGSLRQCALFLLQFPAASSTGRVIHKRPASEVVESCSFLHLGRRNNTAKSRPRGRSRTATGHTTKKRLPTHFLRSWREQNSDEAGDVVFVDEIVIREIAVA